MQELSKAKLKQFSALRTKKYRHARSLYLAEGFKLAEEILKHDLEPHAILIRGEITLPESLSQLPDAPNCYSVSPSHFDKLSTMDSPEGIIMVMNMGAVQPHMAKGAFTYVLDGIRDPGNLGTILRTASWLGVTEILCFNNCADCYNPKVVRASMGAIFSTKVEYQKDLENWLQAHQKETWATTLSGDPVTAVSLESRKYLLIGSESHGISINPKDFPELRSITIPASGFGESLNAAIAAGIIGWEWVREGQKKS